MKVLFKGGGLLMLLWLADSILLPKLWLCIWQFCSTQSLA